MISSRRLTVDFGQFWLAPFGSYPVLNSQVEPTRVENLDAFAGSGTPWLLEAAVDGVGIIVGTCVRSGPVQVTLGDDPSAAPQGDGYWQERAELVVSINEELMVNSGSTFQEPLRVPAPAEPGPHRVIVLATGRGVHRDLAIDVTEDPVEEYLVLIKPV